MARNYSPTVHDVEKAYDRAKAVLPGLNSLRHDAPGHHSTRWYIGSFCIGQTSREARAFLEGARLAIYFAGLAGAA